MKDLLNRIRVLDRKPSDEEIKDFVEQFCDGVPIALLEEAAKVLKAERKGIVSGDLLEWMRENDQVKFETDEEKIEIRTYVNSKIENPDLAFAWLEERQYGPLIKDTLDMAKGEYTQAVADALEALGVSYTKTSGIHAQTLKKVISDRLKAGEDLPSEEDGFKVNYYDECEVKGK